MPGCGSPLLRDRKAAAVIYPPLLPNPIKWRSSGPGRRGAGDREGAGRRTGPRRGGQTAPQRAADLALFIAAAFFFLILLWRFGALSPCCVQDRCLGFAQERSEAGLAALLLRRGPSHPAWEAKQPRRSNEGRSPPPLQPLTSLLSRGTSQRARGRSPGLSKGAPRGVVCLSRVGEARAEARACGG